MGTMVDAHYDSLHDWIMLKHLRKLTFENCNVELAGSDKIVPSHFISAAQLITSSPNKLQQLVFSEKSHDTLTFQT